MVLGEQPRLVLAVERVVQVKGAVQVERALSEGVLVQPVLVQSGETVEGPADVAH